MKNIFVLKKKLLEEEFKLRKKQPPSWAKFKYRKFVRLPKEEREKEKARKKEEEEEKKKEMERKEKKEKAKRERELAKKLGAKKKIIELKKKKA